MKRFQNLILILGVIVLALIPLAVVQRPEPGPDGKEVEIFAGADGQAEELIRQIVPDYQPWFEPFFEPASGEIESLLFALQAALGAGFIGYWLGSATTRSRLQKEQNNPRC
jgi:cobalt/nickel transport protein